MRTNIPLLAAIAVTSAACSSTINTLPPVADASAAAQEVRLTIPDGLEVRSISYSATMYPNVSGTSGSYGVTSTSVGGRAFVQVSAVDRATGEQVLLLYEDIARRPEPIQIIRFRTEGAVASGSNR